MTWNTTAHGWPRLETWREDGTLLERIILRPITGEMPRARGVSFPTSAPGYLLGTLFVAPSERHQGRGKALLRMAASRLLELHEEAWLGLLSDNLRTPVGRTRPDIRATWDSFLSDLESAAKENGFVLLTAELGLE